MRTKLIAILAVVLLLTAGSASFAAQSAPTASSLPMCEPVTLATLFPPEDEHTDDEPVDTTAPTEPGGEGGEYAPAKPAPTTTTTTKPPPPPCRPFVYEMSSPTASPPGIISNFGADRPGGRKHKGSDIPGPKLMPVYAVSDGTVIWIRDEQGGDCCALALRHPDGWTSYYIHLNNDTFGTDDGLGYGIAPGLRLGSQVSEGDLIGWNGDSGNAETTVPHIHFELRMPGNIAIDARASILAASLPVAVADTAAAPVQWREPFSDDDDTPYEAVLGRLASIGRITGCGEPVGTAFCPDDRLTGDDALALIETITGVAVDPAVITYERPVETAASAAVAAGGDTCGVSEFCGTGQISNAELGQLVEAAFAKIDRRDAADAPNGGEAAAAADGADLAAAEVPADDPAPAGTETEAASPDATVEDGRSSVPALAPLVIGRCEDQPDHESRLQSVSTRGELAVYLAERLGMVRSVPCGQLS